MPAPAIARLPVAARATPLSRRLGDALAAPVRALRHMVVRRRALAEIERMDEATLRDIGVTRWELRRALDQAPAVRGWSPHP